MRDIFTNLIEEVVIAIERFVASFCFIILLFVTSAISVLGSPLREDSNFKLILMSLFGVVFCTFCQLLYEKVKDKLNFNLIAEQKWAIDFSLGLLSLFSYFAFKDFNDNLYVMLSYFGIMITLFAGIIYLSSGTHRFSKFFSYLFKNTALNASIGLILTAGIFICLAAFYALIYTSGSGWKSYTVAALFIWIVVFLSLSLSTIPRQDTELKIPQLFKTLVLYISLPVYLLLLSILCMYLGKIVLTLSFPSGQINWVVSFASLLFVFFVFSLEQYREENRLTELFVKFGGYVMLPIMGIQFWAIYIRLADYGLTTTRYISLVLNILAVAFVVVSLIKKGIYLKKMLLVGAAASLLLTMTPLNVIDVPIWNQATRLTALLQKYNMIEDGKIIPNKSVPSEDQEKIVSAYEYLRYAKKQVAILANINGGRFEETFGFPDSTGHKRRAGEIYVYYKYDCLNEEGMNIAPYSKMHAVSFHDNHGKNDSAFAINGLPIDYDLQASVAALYKQYGTPKDSKVKMEFHTDSGKLVLTSLSFTADVDKIITIDSFYGYVLTN